MKISKYDLNSALHKHGVQCVDSDYSGSVIAVLLPNENIFITDRVPSASYLTADYDNGKLEVDDCTFRFLSDDGKSVKEVEMVQLRISTEEVIVISSLKGDEDSDPTEEILLAIANVLALTSGKQASEVVESPKTMAVIETKNKLFKF